jgi:hypothetical protein
MRSITVENGPRCCTITHLLFLAINHPYNLNNSSYCNCLYTDSILGSHLSIPGFSIETDSTTPSESNNWLLNSTLEAIELSHMDDTKCTRRELL